MSNTKPLESSPQHFQHDITELGLHDMRYRIDVPFGISALDRRQHLYIIGRTGTGKSTLLLNLFAEDVAKGRGVALIDPHGDLAQQALGLIPPERSHSVVYINPADLEFPVGLNVLENIPFDQRAALASSIVAAFKNLWSSSWGPRLEHILYNSVALLLDQEDTSLVSMVRLLDDKAYRTRLIKNARDPIVQRFWEVEYPTLVADIGTEVLQPLQNKLGALIGAPALRNIIGQVRSTFSPRHLMDNNQILIANLSKGLIGETHASLLGALLVNTFGHTAMSRADQQEHDRTDFFLLVDEFQNFTTDAFAILLSEARKYRLCMTLTNQYLEQLPDITRAAILGNVGSMIVYRVSAGDAKILAPELSLHNDVESLTLLDRGHTRARLLNYGEIQETVFGRMHPPPRPSDKIAQLIIDRSRRHFTRPRAEVEDKLERFLRPERAN